MRARRASVAAAWTLALLSLHGCVRLSEPENGFACQRDTDCETHEICRELDPALGKRCVHEDSCTSSSECLGIESCVDGRCTTPSGVECTSRAPYTCAPFACDFSTSRCRTSCSSNGQCELGAVCDDGVCREPECSEPDDARCAPFACVEGLCRERCANTEIDCADGLACIDGACVEPPPPPKLAVNEPCSEDDACNSGHCVDGVCGCARASECSVDVCHEVLCDSGVCRQTQLGRGEACATGVCNDEAACVLCLDDGDCAASPCWLQTCVNQTCLSQGPARSGAACEGGVCDGTGSCVECLSSTDCEVDDCQTATCTSQRCVLQTTADCDGGA